MDGLSSLNGVMLTATFEGDTSGLEGVGTTAVVAVDETHQFGGSVAVVVWRAVGVCYWYC